MEFVKKTVRLPLRGHDVNFFNRDRMSRKIALNKANLPKAVPTTSLPVDSTGGQTVSCPMDGNDTLGDCGEAMIAHVDNILTYGQGKPGWTESVFALTNLENQYLQISQGDNGMDESMLIGPSGAWTVGIAGVAAAKAVDSLDVDVTNIPLTRYLIDNFYAVCLAWSVPDNFLQGFNTGTTWDAPAVPDPNNGHYTPLADVSTNGTYTLLTWGTYCFVTPGFVADVQPQTFVAFSPRQFNAQGYDSKGRHVSTQAAAWVAVGGNAGKVAAVVAIFPPITPPAPTPPSPVPVPVPVPVPNPDPPPAPPTPPVPTPVPPPSSLVVIDPSGNSIPFPAGYTAQGGSGNTLAASALADAADAISNAQASLGSTNKSMSAYRVEYKAWINQLLNNKLLIAHKASEEKRQTALAAVYRQNFANPTFNWAAVMQAAAQLFIDLITMQTANFEADLTALIAALTA